MREQHVRVRKQVAAGMGASVRVKEGVQRNNHIPLLGPQLPLEACFPWEPGPWLAPPLLPQPRRHVTKY